MQLTSEQVAYREVDARRLATECTVDLALCRKTRKGPRTGPSLHGDKNTHVRARDDTLCTWARQDEPLPLIGLRKNSPQLTAKKSIQRHHQLLKLKIERRTNPTLPYPAGDAEGGHTCSRPWPGKLNPTTPHDTLPRATTQNNRQRARVVSRLLVPRGPLSEPFHRHGRATQPALSRGGIAAKLIYHTSFGFDLLSTCP